jgi:hypothetical protein
MRKYRQILRRWLKTRQHADWVELQQLAAHFHRHFPGL